MNSLSWLLYIGDVAGNTQTLFATAAGLVFTVWCLRWVGTGMTDGDIAPPDTRWAVVACALAATSCLMPSTRTVYMIAASEMGEKVVATPQAKEAFDALRDKIKEVLKPAPAKP
jgi:hypothetical protein